MRQTGTTHAQASHWISISIALIIAGSVLWSAFSIDVDAERIGNATERIADFIGRMIPPDFSVLPDVVNGTIETMQIAILGTVGCILTSAILGPLAASTVTPPVVHRPLKFVLAIIRAVPMIVVAMLMVAALGLGPLPGIVAIAIHATGMLAKFYAEAIEDVDTSSVAALESTGAGIIQRLRFAVWPQTAPVIVRDTLFRFELNLRESLILGIVGAGGIGFYIQTYVRSFQYQKAATLTLVVVGLVLLVEFANSFIRRQLNTKN